MKYIILISIISLSCNYSNHTQNDVKEAEHKINELNDRNREKLSSNNYIKGEVEIAVTTPVSVKLKRERTLEDIEVDDYYIGYEIISANVAQNSKINAERAYFISSDKSQFIEIRLATDYNKEKIFHYSIETHEVNYPSSELINSRNNLYENIKNASILDLDMFKTIKGISLGNSIEDVISEYGEYDEKTLYQNLEILKWNYFGREMFEYGEQNDENLRIANNSLGQSNVFYFESNKLIAIETSNYLP